MMETNKNGLDERNLDEYGVWVKAGPEESLEHVDEEHQGPDQHPAKRSDEREEKRTNLTQRDSGGQGNMASNEEKTYDNEESATSNDTGNADSVDFSFPDSDDDLDSLSDLLMNIDSDTDSDETIYLEDDDLSLDLDDGSDDLLDEQEGSDFEVTEDSDSEIIIPGLDDGLSLDGLDTEVKIPEEESTDSTLEMHSIEESGFDDFLGDDVSDSDTPDEAVQASENIFSEESLGLPEEDDFDAPFGLNDPIEKEVSSKESLVSDDEESKPEASSHENEAEDSDGMDYSLDLDESFDQAMRSQSAPEAAPEPHSEDEPANDDEFSMTVGETPDLGDDLMPGAELERGAVSESDIASQPEDAAVDTLPKAATPESPAFNDVAEVEKTMFEDEVELPKQKISSDSILRSIEEELHAIRSELTDLRSELKRLQQLPAAHAEALESAATSLAQRGEELAETAIQEEDHFDPSVEDENSDTTLEEQAHKAKGFFDDDDDETIALTGDELDNILNSAEFTEEAGEPTQIDDTEFEGPEHGSDVDPFAAAMEAAHAHEPAPETAESSRAQPFEDSGDADDFPPIQEIRLQELSTPEPTVPEEDTAAVTEDSAEPEDNLDIGEKLAGIEDLSDDANDNDDMGPDLSSVQIDLPEDFDPEAASEPNEEDEFDDGELKGAPVVEEHLEVPVPEEEDAALPQPHGESALPEQGSEPDSDAVDHHDEPSAGTQGIGDEDEGGLPIDLRAEIKAVLIYMDQLLESLPEEKIEEFAKSEHFDTYRRLFEEMGL